MCAAIGLRNVLYQSTKQRAELKLSRHLPNCAMSDFFPGLLSSFFFVNWNVRISEPASSNRRTKQRFASMPSTVNWRYYNVSRHGNPQRENTMDSQSFEGFYAQLDCQITNGNENQTLLTLLKYRLFRVQKQNRTKQEIMKNIAN